ncbi:MAG: tRNA uridine-5-carboxymethylaminomethyl(34) synthesis GTPase MnmE [Firmicutes bacterium]|nr:tRNA uridine-5-carboxymethylaminomethyl(34) synthesis GTPase MnmE [Bacillota bacterium]
MLTNKTITAVATPPGVGAVAIIRISGEKTIDIINKIFTRQKSQKSPMLSHKLYYGKITDESNNIIDEVMCVLMRAPRSYTCEDTAEIHCHGGIATVAAVLDIVLKNGANLAEPGEFTKRAFLNGRIDLSQAEAVMELISAKNQLARRATLRKLAGGLSQKVKSARQQILSWLANIELSIDYPEHEEEAENLATIQQECVILLQNLDNLAKTANIGNFIQMGVPTAIIGRPNVGKSSLMNAILQQERAIVTEIAGTTRDTLTESVVVRNIPILLTDTAGIRQNLTDFANLESLEKFANLESLENSQNSKNPENEVDKIDKIEQIGINRTIKSAENAELVLFVLDNSEPPQQEDIAIMQLLNDKKKIIVLNKNDLPPKFSLTDLTSLSNLSTLNNVENVPTVKISAKTGEGLNELYSTIESLFFGGKISVDDDIITKERDKLLLQQAISHIKQAQQEISASVPEDIISISLRAAYVALGEILGEVVADDIVDRIFAEFCVGK